jgi:hypothetical protein
VKPNERVPLDNITVDVKPNGTGVLYASGPPGASVTIALSFVGGSNGHIHSDGSNDPNIVGKISPVSFTLPDGYPQNVPTTFTATNFCGLIQGCASFSDGTQQVNSFNVHFDGLIPLPSHPSLHPYTHDLTHPQNTFGVPKLVSALLALGDAYGKVFFGPAYVLWVNDMSLPKGGRFCTHPKGHKWGGEVDISYNLMTDSERQWFDQNADKFFAWHILHGDPLHWHCSINPKSKESSC